MKERPLFIAMIASLVVNLILIILFVVVGLRIVQFVRAVRGCVGFARQTLLSSIGEPPASIPFEYDSQIALYVARLVHAFEFDPVSFLPPDGFTLKVYLPPSHIGCILEDNYGRQWILFRGTQTAEEGHLNLQFDQVNGIHRGFQTLFNKFEHLLLNTLHKNSQIVIGGHSLGAALTALTVARLGTGTVAYAFASPRIGDQRLANKLKTENLYTLLNSDDIVTNLPPAVCPNLKEPTKPFIYTHAGKTIVFSINRGSWIQNHLLPIYEEYLLTQELHHSV